jgi:hypothetical protein
MEEFICSPHEYNDPKFVEFMKQERLSRNHRWIYAIIDGYRGRSEQIFIDREKWCLCLDKHHGYDTRYLVIFKDESLMTIRDLREQHLPMLEEIHHTVLQWIESRHRQKYFLYFHYMPSVFQLHLHVNSNRQHINASRAHFMQTVLRNLRHSSEHYKNALILSSWCKTMKRSNLHAKLTGCQSESHSFFALAAAAKPSSCGPVL